MDARTHARTHTRMHARTHPPASERQRVWLRKRLRELRAKRAHHGLLNLLLDCRSFPGADLRGWVQKLCLQNCTSLCLSACVADWSLQSNDQHCQYQLAHRHVFHGAGYHPERRRCRHLHLERLSRCRTVQQRIRLRFMLETNVAQMASASDASGGQWTFTTGSTGDYGPGTYHFICTLYSHCVGNTKVAITVVGTTTTSPTNAPTKTRIEAPYSVDVELSLEALVPISFPGTTYYSQLTIHYSLLTTHSSLIATHHVLLTTDY